MKTLLLFASVMILLASCAERKNDNISSNVIDIESSMQNVAKLKVSDFGNSIRYIPLETTDDCLIDDRAIVKVLKDYIVIESNQICYLFDKKDGKFISIIGHRGQDPEAYSSNTSFTDEKEEYLYFLKQPDNLIKYDMTGKFSGKITFPVPPGLASYYLLTDNEIITYHSGINSSYNFTLAFHDTTGALKDTTDLLLPAQEETISDIMDVSVIRGSDIFGCWAETGAVIINYRNDNKLIIAPNAATLWNHAGNVRFKENFIDTVYNISDGILTPYITFNTGSLNWPANERTSKNNNNKRVFISYVSENNSFVFFQCITGLYTDEHILYNGLFNKKTGETKLGKNSDGIQDDMSGFMTFKPNAMSTAGELVSMVDAVTVMEWVEKNPEAKNNAKLSFLKDFNDEMNPVVIIVL